MLRHSGSLRAFALALILLPVFVSHAFAHAVCGDRIFPATLGIDDPGVGDELALPTLTWLPQNSDGSEEFDASFSYTKTIFPNFGLSVTDGPTWLRPGGYGWGDVDTEAKYSLPYYNSNVAAIDNAFFKRLVPITKFTFSKPISNFLPGTNQTTGRIQPGAIYMADTWQFALEAIIPINAASGHAVGAVGELHFFLDD
ncbi:MAG: hypothetical protein ACRECV_20880, partial [Xanthobacteraceae bacterium]